jgi:hypothetical protein
MRCHRADRSHAIRGGWVAATDVKGRDWSFLVSAGIPIWINEKRVTRERSSPSSLCPRPVVSMVDHTQAYHGAQGFRSTTAGTTSNRHAGCVIAQPTQRSTRLGVQQPQLIMAARKPRLDLDETCDEWGLAASLRKEIDRDQQHDPDADREHERATVVAARKNEERGMAIHTRSQGVISRLSLP